MIFAKGMSCCGWLPQKIPNTAIVTFLVKYFKALEPLHEFFGYVVLPKFYDSLLFGQ